jgi:acetyl-CoA C-acetyltransferase
MTEIGIVSIGHSKYGAFGKSTPEMMGPVIEECMSRVEKGIDPKDVDLVIVSTVDNQFSNQHQTGALALRYLKNSNAEAFRVEAACASGSLATSLAYNSIKTGLAKNVLVVGFETMTRLSTPTVTSILIRGGSPEENAHGITQPAAYAMMAQLYAQRYGATEDDYAMVSVKNHANALKNPLAMFHKKLTVDDVKRSKMVASPIRLMHCSPITDGAVALLLSRDPKKYTDTPVYIKGVGMAHDSLGVWEREDPTFMTATRKAAMKAYAMAGIDATKVDIAEVHDAFTTVEFMVYEALGFADKGQGFKMLREGIVMPDGSLPINVSGGLKAKGHPVGATGAGMIAEIFLQLRGEIGDRQVPDVERGLVENHGGTGATSVVTILER